MDFAIKGKNALVTGGTKGIGAAIAESLAKEGVNVVVTARNSAPYEDNLKQKLDEYGVKHAFYKMDVSKFEEVQTVVKEIKKDFSSIDILVNNAGITKDTLLLRMQETDWDAVININLKGAFNTLKAVAPIMMKSRWGRVVNISSVVGEMGNLGQINYSASKAGLLGLTKSAARELAARNITVNAITPGFIVSDMTDKLSDEIKEEFKKQIPLGRFANPEEVADLVSFLTSSKAAYITGQVIGINGGMYM